MAGPTLQASAQTSAQALPSGVPAYRSALMLLASLFFVRGFITVINNTLLPHLRSVFELDYTRTTLIESVWFIAYFVASLLRRGYARLRLRRGVPPWNRTVVPRATRAYSVASGSTAASARPDEIVPMKSSLTPLLLC